MNVNEGEFIYESVNCNRISIVLGSAAILGISTYFYLDEKDIMIPGGNFLSVFDNYDGPCHHFTCSNSRCN